MSRNSWSRWCMNLPGSDCAGRVQLRDGRLHIPGEVYERVLLNCPSLALLARDGRWQLLPLFGGAGGLLIKIRNARGDRVVEAQEFFRSQGFEQGHEPVEFDLNPEPEGGAFQLVMQSS